MTRHDDREAFVPLPHGRRIPVHMHGRPSARRRRLVWTLIVIGCVALYVAVVAACWGRS